MCGLVGCLSNHTNGLSAREMEIFLQNLVLNQFRGRDSTGVFGVNNSGEISLVKEVGPPEILFKTAGWKPFYEEAYRKGKILIGHGRAATRGDVTADNAHPFQVPYEDDDKESIVLVHNGTLASYQTLPDFHKFKVDSHWLAHCMMVHGPEKTLAEVEGAMAIMWWDSKAKTINFFRNNERPLHYSVVEDGAASSMIINSEAVALRYLIAKHNLKSTSKHDVYYFAPMTWYSLPFNNLEAEWTMKEIKKVARVYHSPTNYKYQYGMYGRYENDYEDIFSSRYRPGPNRTFEYDVDQIKKKNYLRVSFCGTPANKRTTHYPGSYSPTLVDYGMKPYKEHLREIYLSKDEKNLIMEFNDGKGTEWSVETPLAINTTAVTVLEDPLEIKGPFINPANHSKFKPRRRYKWTHKLLDGTVVKHEAEIQKDVYFNWYENSVDGRFEEGDEATLEIVTFEQVGNSTFQRIKACPVVKTPVAVDFYWFVASEAEAHALCAYGFVTAKIKKIRLAEEIRYNQEGTYVEIEVTDCEVLKEVKEITENQLKDAAA